ncbi:MAG TPA: metallophosphoesterase [Pyrinomonadaceae bacterium]|nr:metallophosphoesterase [Pyrinomonadaceae bacterium]
MKRSIPHWYQRLLLLLGLYAFLSVVIHAQVSFVQITDLHIFDDVHEPTDNRLDNKAALASCIDQINQRITDNNGVYDFVVITGDLGIEHFVNRNSEENTQSIDEKLRRGASDFASMLVLSKVRRWLFVPGNNDVPGEQPDKVKYYHLFIESLADEVRKSNEDFEIIDLCPKENTEASRQYDSRSGLFRIKEKSQYAFIGFDNTTFKNLDPEANVSAFRRGAVRRINANFELQKKHVAQITDLLKDVNITYAYIFYHIPEIDDPHLAALGEAEDSIKTRNADKTLTGDAYGRSAWFVNKEIRDQWRQVVNHPKVFGRFAGHFHDPRRTTYQNFAWMTSSETYLSDSLDELHVCPPLAQKFQETSTERARGFQDVHIDDRGMVSTRIFWLEGAGWNLSADRAAVEATSLKQLEMGLTYENLGRLKEAEAAYLKAAENDWQPTRQKALASLKRVVYEQDSVRERYLFGPMRAAWSVGITGFFALLPALLVVLGIYVYKWWRGRKDGKYQLKIGPIIDSPKGEAGAIFERVTTMMHGRMRTHYKRRNLIEGEPRLPMIASSQSEDVPTIIESFLPGGLGKLMALLLKRTESPKYSIVGVMRSDIFMRNRRIFLSLRAEGESLKNWSVDGNADESIGGHKKLAYEALIHVVRDINK